MKNAIWSLVFIFSATGICSAQTTLYLPQFVDGAQLAAGVGWVSAIAVTNPAALGTPAASGTITLTNDNGTPLNLAFFDENGNGQVGNTFQLAGGQTKFFISPQGNSNGPLAFNSGFAAVTSNLPVTSGIVFTEFALNGGPIGTGGAPASSPLLRQAIFAIQDKGDQLGTGLAVANPGTGTATITFQLLDKSGNQIVAPVTRTLAANNHTAFFISELFPSAPSAVFGTVRITSDQALVTVALVFQGATFGTVPVIPLQ
jgi:hypothetical protein